LAQFRRIVTPPIDLRGPCRHAGSVGIMSIGWRFRYRSSQFRARSISRRVSGLSPHPGRLAADADAREMNPPLARDSCRSTTRKSIYRSRDSDLNADPAIIRNAKSTFRARLRARRETQRPTTTTLSRLMFTRPCPASHGDLRLLSTKGPGQTASTDKSGRCGRRPSLGQPAKPPRYLKPDAPEPHKPSVNKLRSEPAVRASQREDLRFQQPFAPTSYPNLSPKIFRCDGL